jgi:hypothetical protein
MPGPSPPIALVTKPTSVSELTKIADFTLREAGAVGTLPTPIDSLLAAAEIGQVFDPETAKEQFLANLAEGAREGFLALWQKVRGIADLRERVVYVPTTTTVPRILFAKGHELGHEVIPWHRLPLYQDDERTLRPDVRAVFEREANYFSSEVIFQGSRFARRARDFHPSLEAVFTLADLYGASRQATLVRLAEGHDEALAAITYVPDRYSVDEQGRSILRAPRVVPSPSFLSRYESILLPEELRTGHPWADARESSRPCDGDIRFDCGSGPVRFIWQAWWNQYCLMVLLRKPPALGLVGRWLRPAE